jgi:predicted DNA-binding protein YlxM (UPF0122 family)
METAIDRQARMSLLYDYYGQLLSGRRQDVFRLYHEDNYSLGEIAEELGISRQGVHDALKKAETALLDYETKLGLLAKHDAYQKALRTVEKQVTELLRTGSVGANDTGGSADADQEGGFGSTNDTVGSGGGRSTQEAFSAGTRKKLTGIKRTIAELDI